MKEEKRVLGTQKHQDKKEEVKKQKQDEQTKSASGEKPGAPKK